MHIQPFQPPKLSRLALKGHTKGKTAEQINDLARAVYTDARKRRSDVLVTDGIAANFGLPPLAMRGMVNGKAYILLVCQKTLRETGEVRPVTVYFDNGNTFTKRLSAGRWAEFKR